MYSRPVVDSAHDVDRILSDTSLLKSVIAIARRAGDAILEIYSSCFEVREKPDSTPVTDADMRAEAVILDGLASLGGPIPVVSEEEASGRMSPAACRRFWLVDPLDGTREFVRRNGEFTVNIALVEDGRPVLGVVFAPALGRLYGGAGGVAFVEDSLGSRPIACARARPGGLVVVSSRSHGDAAALARFLSGRFVAESVTVGSCLKFCLVAQGRADVYPRLGRTMEWDTAAGHAVLAAAGGAVTDLHGEELMYGKPAFVNPPFVATGLAGDRGRWDR